MNATDGTVPTRGQPVALFDLDHTLFEYSTLRRSAMLAAVDTVCRRPEETVDLLLKELVAPTTDLIAEWGFPNLRRQWNSPAIYAFSKAFDEDVPAAEADAFWEAARSAAPIESATGPFQRRLNIQRAAAALESHPAIEPVLARIRETSAAESFQAPRTTFDAFVEQNAVLLPGGERLLATLRASGVAVGIVTEGDSDIQLLKATHLRLDTLADAVVVTDQTLGVLPLLEELAARWKGQEVPPAVVDVFDALEPYTVKSRQFYIKCVHALVGSGLAGLEGALKSLAFVPASEWPSLPKPRIAMVGDRYRKDLEPLLEVCPQGVLALRIVAGKYANEDPLDEVVSMKRPLPAGYFTTLPATLPVFREWINANDELCPRPAPLLPKIASLEALLNGTLSLSDAAMETLKAMLDAWRM